jgi:hypothetical protein
MSFSNYRADSFIDLLNKRVEDLNYKIVLALEQINGILKFLKDGGIPIPSGDGGGSSSSGVDYSVDIAAIHQIIDVLPVLPNLPQESLTWPELIETVKKVPNSFLPTTLRDMYDNVFSLLTGSSTSGGSLGVSYSAEIEAIHQIIDVLPVLPNPPSVSITWAHLIEAAEKIPTFFTTSTLHTMFDNIAQIMDGGGSGGGSGSSGVDYSADIQALQTATAKIPAWFTTGTLQEIWTAINNWAPKLLNLPTLPNLPNEILTWGDVVNAVKMIPELQQTVTNVISQLNSQSLINLQTLQTALDQADGSLETISAKLQQMQ